MAQGKLSKWDGSNIGYTIHLDTLETQPTQSVYVLLIASMFYLLFFGMLVCCVASARLKHIRKKERKYILDVFYSVGIVTWTLNVIEIYVSFFALDHDQVFYVTIGTRKIITLINISIAFICGFIGWVMANEFPHIKYNVFSICCCRNSSHRVIHFLLCFNVAFFTVSILTSICPTILLSCIYPTQMISLVLCISFILASTIIGIVLFQNCSKQAPKVDQWKLLSKLMYCYLLLPFMFMMCIHIKIAANTDHTESRKLIEIVVSILPSLVLGYFFRKWMNFFHNENEDRPSYNEASTETVEHTEEETEQDSNIEERAEEDGNNSKQLLRRR